MTNSHSPSSADIAVLADEWQAESKKHALAALEGDCDVGDDEWCLHRESARIYRKCADQLVTAIARGVLVPDDAQAVGVPAWESLTASIRPMIESVCSDGNSDAARLAKDIADRILASLSLTRPHGESNASSPAGSAPAQRLHE